MKINVFSGNHLAQVFGNHLLQGCEISKYDGDLGVPNVYKSLETDEADQKVKNLMNVFGSQHDKSWFIRDTFRSLVCVPGVECRAASGYAGAFYGRKLVFGAGSWT